MCLLCVASQCFAAGTMVYSLSVILHSLAWDDGDLSLSSMLQQTKILIIDETPAYLDYSKRERERERENVGHLPFESK